mgnify:CR=1 FL=1
MDLDDLWRELAAGWSLGPRSVHGVDHWARVERNALYLARHVADVPELPLRLFAAFHDSCRLDDGRDLEHGPRAAALLHGRRADFPDLADDLFARLVYACEHHTTTIHTADPLVAVCWDADRLDIGRVGFVVDADLLNTAEARRLVRQRQLGRLDGLPLRSLG